MPITPVTKMPDANTTPSGTLTSSTGRLKLSAHLLLGAATLSLISQGPSGAWGVVPGGTLSVGDDGARDGDLYVNNPEVGRKYHVLADRLPEGAVAYLSEVNIPSGAGVEVDLSAPGPIGGGTPAAGSFTTLASSALLSAGAGEQVKGSSPAAAADAVGLGVADANGAGTGALVKTFEGGGTHTEYVASGAPKTIRYAQSLADDATIALPVPTNVGEVSVGTYDEGGSASVKPDGTVVSRGGSTNFVATDTDAKLCVFNSGGVPTVRNRLGGARWVLVTYTLA